MERPEPKAFDSIAQANGLGSDAHIISPTRPNGPQLGGGTVMSQPLATPDQLERDAVWRLCHCLRGV